MVTNTILELKRALAEVCGDNERESQLGTVREEREECGEEETGEDRECSSPASSFTFHPSEVRGRQGGWEAEDDTGSSSNEDSVGEYLYCRAVPRLLGYPYTEMVNEESSDEEDKRSSSCPSPEPIPSPQELHWSEGNPDVNVFVPTTRKIFSPVLEVREASPVEAVRGAVTEAAMGAVIGRPPRGTGERAQSASPAVRRRTGGSPLADGPRRRNRSFTGLDPLPEPGSTADPGVPPTSPASVRPGVRSAIERYNRKIAGQDSGSGDTVPSVPWRSPLAERRSRTGRDTLEGGRKSASAATLLAGEPPRAVELSKSDQKASSADVINFSVLQEVNQSSLPLPESRIESNGGEETYSTPESLRLRALRIKKAKEEFLSRGLEREAERMCVVVGEGEIKRGEGAGLVVKCAEEEEPGAAGPEAARPEDRGKNSGLGNLWRRLGKREGSSSNRGSLAGGGDTPEAASPAASCPASPVLPRPKLDPTSWIRNPAKILFRPKGKYTFNNK